MTKKDNFRFDKIVKFMLSMLLVVNVFSVVNNKIFANTKQDITALEFTLMAFKGKPKVGDYIPQDNDFELTSVDGKVEEADTLFIYWQKEVNGQWDYATNTEQKFSEGGKYRLRFNIEPAVKATANYQFTSQAPTLKVSGENFNYTTQPDGYYNSAAPESAQFVAYSPEYTLTSTPTVTFDKENITKIEVIQQPKQNYTEGDKLDLSNLKVKLTDNQNLTQDVAFNDFATYQLTTNLADQKELALTDTSLEVAFKTVKSASIALTIAPKPVTGDYTLNMVDAWATNPVLTTYKKGDTLGIPKEWGLSNWNIRTYRKIFTGWSTSKNALEDGSKVYRMSDKIDQVVADLGKVDENVTLYPIFISQTDIMGKLLDAKSLKANVGIAISLSDKEVLPNTDIKSSTGFEATPDIAQAADRKVNAYYDQDKESYQVVINSDFQWINKKIPLLVSENSLQILKGAEGITNFSGKNPKDYTYEDLVVELDSKVDVATQMKNLTFKSALFRVAAILDENYQPLNATISTPTSYEMETKFSFDNPNKLKKFIIRTILRNSGDNNDKAGSIARNSTTWTATGEDVIGNMVLTSGDPSNISISKAVAKEFAENGDTALKFTGKINGSITINPNASVDSFTKLLLAFMSPMTIPETVAKNKLLIDLNYNKVTFNKNSTALNDAAAQDLSTVNVVHKQSIDSDELVDQKMHGDLGKLEINGKVYHFKGWNTQPDGSGTSFDGNTKVTEDITVYAVWKQESKVVYRFESNVELPQAVKDLLPPEKIGIVGEVVVTPAITNELVVDGVKWKFAGFDQDQVTLTENVITVVGKWSASKVPGDSPKVDPLPIAPIPTPDKPQVTPIKPSQPQEEPIKRNTKAPVDTSDANYSFAIVAIALLGLLKLRNKKY